MLTERWLQDRMTHGTVAALARQMVATGRNYERLEQRLRQFYVLEAVIRNSGDQRRTATELGMSRHSVMRILRDLGLKCADVRALAKQIGGER